MPTVEICDDSQGGSSGECVPWEANHACCEEWDGYPPDLQERAQALSWATIRALTGGRVGSCPITSRPCLSAPCDWCTRNWLNPIVRNGAWLNAVCGCHQCSCTKVCEIDLLGTVAKLTEVSIDGQAQPLDAFRIDNFRFLVRQDGECFPACQNMGSPLGAPGTVGITYVPGIVPDSAGLWAAGVLACEYAKACTGAKCRLPSSVTSVSRQGVTMVMDPWLRGQSSGLFPHGLTGIREVDAYIYSVNPNALKLAPRVWSPDLPRHRVATWS